MAYSAITSIADFLTGNAGTTSAKLGFTADSSRPQSLSRYFGGHSRTSHPYVNGYWQFFISPPCKLFDKVGDHADKWFHATAEGFTPPSRNLNKADLPAQGGVGSSWVTGQSLMRTFSVTHREYRDLPMMRLLELWTSIIVPQIGVSEFEGSDWSATSYKGHAFVALTKPVGDQANNWVIKKEDIEELYYFDGVWPENVPTDALAQDIGSNDIVQYTVNYSFDGWPLTNVDHNVWNAFEHIINNYNYQNTYNINTDDLNGASTGCLMPSPATSNG